MLLCQLPIYLQLHSAHLSFLHPQCGWFEEQQLTKQRDKENIFLCYTKLLAFANSTTNII